MAGEKTEKASPKRRQDERKKGNIFQSKEVVTMASVLIMFTTLNALLPQISHSIQTHLHQFFQLSATLTQVTAQELPYLFLQGVSVILETAFPLLIISGAVAIAFTFFQTKMLFSMKSISFKFNKLNPFKGFKNMVSLKGAVELVKSLFKILLLGYIIFNQISNLMPQVPRFLDMSPNQVVVIMGEFIMGVIYQIAAIFIIIAAIDYLFQWWQYEKNMKMSKQELKEEYKQMEGDPQVKGKIKDLQRQRAQNRMLSDVPTADVIVRNPTHYAIAIAYNPEEQIAPIIIAKGADYIALKIIEIGEKSEVRVLENKPLARGLFEAVEIGEAVPESFYQPVAEVLAFVYNLKKKEL